MSALVLFSCQPLQASALELRPLLHTSTLSFVLFRMLAGPLYSQNAACTCITV